MPPRAGAGSGAALTCGGFDPGRASAYIPQAMALYRPRGRRQRSRGRNGRTLRRSESRSWRQPLHRCFQQVRRTVEIEVSAEPTVKSILPSRSRVSSPASGDAVARQPRSDPSNTTSRSYPPLLSCDRTARRGAHLRRAGRHPLDEAIWPPYAPTTTSRRV